MVTRRSNTMNLPYGSALDTSEEEEAILPSISRHSLICRQISPSGRTNQYHITMAAIWAKKAKSGSKMWVAECKDDQLEYYFLMRHTYWMTFVAKWVLLLLTLFEVPSWCNGSWSICQAQYAALQYSWKLPIVPQGVSFILATISWVTLGFRMWLQYKAHGTAYVFTRWHRFAVVLVCVSLLGTCAYFVGGFAVDWTVVCRPLMFICVSQQPRRTCNRVLESLKGFILLIAALFGGVGFFTWIGIVLFKNTSEGNQYFESWPNALASMWIYYTTANSPNVLITGYNENRYSIIYFIVFTTIMMYLFANVLLAEVYDSYKELALKYLKRFKDNRRFGIEKAFAHLSREGRIPPDIWEAFFVHYCDPYIGDIEVEDASSAEYNFWRANTILDFYHDVRAKDKGLSESAFRSIMNVISDHHIYIPARRPPRLRYYNDLTRSLYNWYKNGWNFCGYVFTWDQVGDMFVLASWLLAFVLCIFFVLPNFTSLIHEPIFWILFAIAWFVTIVTIIKILLFGVDRYLNENHVQHRFDFVTVFGIFAVNNLYVFFYASNLYLERLILMLYLIRGLRLLQYVKVLYHLGYLVLRITPAFVTLLVFLSLVFYVFAVIGMWGFGGRIYPSNPLLAGSQFAASDYWSMNFNDLPSSLVTLFVLMTHNNWYVIASGYLLVAEKYKYVAVFYFVSFYFVCNLVVLNILVASILDASTRFAQVNEKSQTTPPASQKSGSKRKNLPAKCASGRTLPGFVQPTLGSSHTMPTAETMLRRLFHDDEDHSPVSSDSNSTSRQTSQPQQRAATPVRTYGSMSSQRAASAIRPYDSMPSLQGDPT